MNKKTLKALREQSKREDERATKCGELFLKRLLAREYFLNDIRECVLTNIGFTREMPDINADVYVPDFIEMKTLNHKRNEFMLQAFLSNINCPGEDDISVKTTGVVGPFGHIIIKEKNIERIS